MKLSVVIPAYNEEKDIQGAINDVFLWLPSAEVIIVNDASTDATLKKINQKKRQLRKEYSKNLKVLTNKRNRGHGYSVVRGLLAATGDHILYLDADRQIDPANFYDIHSENLNIYDSFSGYRVCRDDKFFRKVISFCLKITILLQHGYWIKDANCPFKIYKREKLLPLIKKLPTSYVIPIACLEVLARKEKYLIGDVPTFHYPYQGVRKGFLQAMDSKFFDFISKAFQEITNL